MRLEDWNDPVAMLGRFSDAIRALPSGDLSADQLFRDFTLFEDALIVPCGDSVTRAIRHLTETGLLRNRFVLEGFPHASGANGHRKRQFAERRGAMKATVLRWADAKEARAASGV